MIFTEQQEKRIKALVLLGLPKGVIKTRFDCSYKDIREVASRIEMSLDQALKVIL